MDRNQLTNDSEVAHRYAQDELQSRLWTAMPAIIQSVNQTKMTCEVQPAVQGIVTNSDGSFSYVNLPLLVDCPLVYPSGGGFALTFPLVAGDEVLVVIASRCIDAWWQNGGTQIPVESRMHDLSDGFAIPGPKSQPNKLSGISTNSVQLRNTAGNIYLGINKISGKLQMQNATQSLKSVLNGIVSIESDLNTALTTFATGLTPITLVAKAAALVTALGLISASISTETANIGSLLE